MSDIHETRYSVQGMKCGGCIAKATDALAKLPGSAVVPDTALPPPSLESYVTAEFDLKTGTATVKGNIDPQSVVKTLAAVGYPTLLKVS